VAGEDGDLTAGGDTVRYRASLGEGASPVSISARLLFQTIGYRWARNLMEYDAFETERFVGYYEASARESAVELATAERRIR
jgi:hypothetical protein